MRTKLFENILVRVFLLALFLALALLAVPREQAASSIPPAAPSADGTDVLQFTSGGHVLGFKPHEMYVASGSHALHVEFVNAEPVKPLSATPGEPGRTVSLSRVTYLNLWRGITLTYDAPGGSLARSAYRLEPFTNGADIRLRYNVPVRVDEEGNLRIKFKRGEMTESAPVAWQEIDGQRVPVHIAFRLFNPPTPETQFANNNSLVGFAIGEYDPSHALIIDPTLTWSTFLGGSGWERGNAIAVDGSGNVYVAGYSTATWDDAIPVQSYTAGWDAFVAKLNSNGVLIWYTFLGGSDNDEGRGIALDAEGNVYVAGLSLAAWGTPVRNFGDVAPDAFAAKLKSDGTLMWHTFLGGIGHDSGYAIAVDGSGNAYVTGVSDDTWQGESAPVRPNYGFPANGAFVAKLDTSGKLLWNTFLNGAGAGSQGYAIAVDGFGNTFVAGRSGGSWGAPLRPYSGGSDAFAAKLDIDGKLIWNTFLGGSEDNDWGYAIAVDGSGNVYVAGYSNATWGAPVRAYTASTDAFAAKLDRDGKLLWNTFLGGYSYDEGYAIAADGSGNVYVAGYSAEGWGAPIRAWSVGTHDGFVAMLNSDGALTWNTFLGGSGNDWVNAMAVDASRNVYVGGFSYSTWQGDLPPIRPFTVSNDAFVAKISGVVTDTIAPTASPNQLPAANVMGWNNSNVTVTWNWADNAGGSGIDPANCTTNSVSLAEGAAITLNAICKDLAGNTGNASYTVKVDKTLPTIVAAATTGPIAAGWYNANVTVHFTCTDAGSGIPASACPADQILSAEGAAVASSSQTVTDAAGNTSAASNVVTVKIDKTAPTIVAAATTGPITAGWYNANVTVHFTCTDAGSGIPAGACPVDQILSAEGAAIASTSQMVTDAAGNTSAASNVVTVKIDKTAPSITITSPGNTSYLLGQVVTANYACSEGGSGLATCVGTVASGANINTVSLGTKTFTVNATDNVGNARSASVSYNIINNNILSFSGFFPPVDNLPALNSVNAGRAIPVKFSLAGNQGLGIFAAGYPVSQQIGCSSGAPLGIAEPTVTAGNSGLSYDAGSKQYNYVWKTDSSWAGTCRQLNVKLVDGTEHKANFEFK